MIQLDTPTHTTFANPKTTHSSLATVKTTKVVTPVTSHVSPWLATLAYPLLGRIFLPFYFGSIEVSGQENIPTKGPVILAPTHRSRWDALLVPYATGRFVTGRDLRFMVSVDEVKGVQGWFIRRLGGFPVDTKHPSIATLRHGVEILQQEEMLVIFPEGGDLKENQKYPVNRLQPGLARLALQAESSQPNLGVKIVPISISYSHPNVPWGCRVKIRIGSCLPVADYTTGSTKQDAKHLTQDLELALKQLNCQI